MFGLGKLFKTFYYVITGRVDRVRKVWAKSPDAIKANYDAVVEKKVQRYQEMKSAVAAMVAEEEKKKDALNTVTAEIVRLEALRSGALAKGKKIADSYNGDVEKARTDADYLTCMTAYKDFGSTLAEKQTRAKELEEGVKGLVTSVNSYRADLNGLLREIDKLKVEKHEAVADIISAEESRKINDMFSGVSDDTTSQELAELREQRTQAKASARISRELGGADNRRAEEDFLSYSANTEAQDEFDKLIGLTKKEAAAPATSEPTRIEE